MKLTDKEFLDREISEMHLTLDNKAFVALAQAVANYLKKYDPKSIIDYGCGTGVYSEVIRQNGFNVRAQDISKIHRDYCKEIYPELKVIARPVKSELMVFIEVAEHMTDEEINKALKIIQPKRILFSSTSIPHETDEKWGHINMKEQKEWITYFESLGYRLKEYLDIPTKWSLFFEK